MSKPRVLLAIVLALGVAIAAVGAEELGGTAAAPPDPQMLLQTIRANRKALIGVNLGLSADEAARFWPVYDRYQQEINASGDRVTALVEDYVANFRTLSNDKALQLVEDYLAAEAERLKVRRAYVPEFAKVLPGRTVARFYQIENKMDAVVRYDLAATIPVIEEQGAAPAK